MPSQSFKNIVWTRQRIQASILSHVTLDATLKTQKKLGCISSCQPNGRKLQCMRATVLPPLALELLCLERGWCCNVRAGMRTYTRKQLTSKQNTYVLIGYTKSTIKFSMNDEGMEGLILKCFVWIWTFHLLKKLLSLSYRGGVFRGK